MIKVTIFWRDNPELGPERCEANYKRVHMQLARQAYETAPGFVSHVYNRVQRHLVHNWNDRTPMPADPQFDAYVELTFETRADLEATSQSPILTEMFADHVNFMDTKREASLAVYEVEETVVATAEGRAREPGRVPR